MKNLTEKVSKAHEDSHWALHRHRRITLEVGLLPTGDYEVIKVIK